MRPDSIVKLKSGGPDMKVTAVEHHEIVTCTWKDDAGGEQSSTFRKETLDPVLQEGDIAFLDPMTGKTYRLATSAKHYLLVSVMGYDIESGLFFGVCQRGNRISRSLDPKREWCAWQIKDDAWHFVEAKSVPMINSYDVR